MNGRTCEIITVPNISAFAVVLKHCQLSFINQHLSYGTHRDPLHLCTRGLSNTTASFEYTTAILVVRFVWQPTSRLFRLMSIIFSSSQTNQTRVCTNSFFVKKNCCINNFVEESGYKNVFT